MKTVAELCKPRDSVFVDTTRDDTLNLSDLVEGRIDAEKFFDENFKTRGMEMLFETAFDRFEGKSATGVIKLTQAMGGGKTHNMIALALLSQSPSLRKKVFGSSREGVGVVKVIAFSGRDSDAALGIWGSLAEQLGKKDLFSSYYSPLKAPGESAWINLLQGQKILILLDELPPYLENGRSIQIGNSDLCQVTTTALSNLFSALGKEQMANVCLVFSDLKATYESGSALLQSSFKELENEANRVALNVEPVALNSDEIYDILRKRLFETFPEGGCEDVNEIAIEFKDAVERAGKSGLTNYTTSTVYTGIKDSYPFHPSIKELYARFKENQGFQQTRGLIKLMRQVVREFYESHTAEDAYLINVFDINLNNQRMLNMIKEIKPSLDTAINHDIAQAGKSVAETIDKNYESEYRFPYAQTTAKLLLVASLSDLVHGLNGLTDSEIIGYLCAPGRDVNQYKKVLEEIKSTCWYLKIDNRGRYFFQNTKNMVAEMNSLVDSYSNEQARKDLRKSLEKSFAPNLRSCYELLYVMPAVDEITLDMNKVSLVIYEPYEGSGMHPDLMSFYENAVYKNRVMFLTGQRSIMKKLLDNSKRLTAIRQIITDFKNEHISESDPQYKEALSQEVKAVNALNSSIRETFITLYYPMKRGLESSDFKLEFVGNSFNGEDQIIKTLNEAQKFQDLTSDDSALETMRKKCESRIFTQKSMTWQLILERAATETGWQWFHPDQMERLKKYCFTQDSWREIGGYVRKGPFDKEPTEVSVEQIGYDPKTKEFTLRVRPVYGDTVYYDVGSEPTPASAVVPTPFITKDTDLYFICVDNSSDNPHPMGSVKHFQCTVPIKHEQRTTSHGIVMTLETHPSFEVRYTTDGSNPKESGGTYTGEFVIPDGCKFIRTAVYNHGELVETKDIKVEESNDEPAKTIDDNKPLEYTYKSMKKCPDTAAAYNALSMFSAIPDTLIKHFTVTISEKANSDNYLEITTATVYYDTDSLKATVDLIRESAFAGREANVEFEYKTVLFATGTAFKNWVDMNKLDLNEMFKQGEIRQ